MLKFHMSYPNLTLEIMTKIAIQRFRLIFYAIFFFNFIVGQNVKILSHEEKVEIPYVLVIYTNNGMFVNGEYADSLGNYKINNNINYDKISLSCVDYNEVICKKIINDTIVKLQSKITQLKEVVLFGSKPMSLSYKFKKSKKDLSLNLGSEYALFFENLLTTNYKIESIVLNINKLDDNSVVRLKFYDGIQKFPNENNLIQFLNVSIPKGSFGLFKIDVSFLNLLFPYNGIFVSIEGIDGVENERNIFSSKKHNFRFKTLENFSIPFFMRNSIYNNHWIEANIFIKENYEKTFNKEIDLKHLVIPDIRINISEING